MVLNFDYVRQKQGADSNLCSPNLETPFTVPSVAAVATLGPLGDTILAADSRTYSCQAGLKDGLWYKIIVDDPRPVSVLYEESILHALTANGERLWIDVRDASGVRNPSLRPHSPHL